MDLVSVNALGEAGIGTDRSDKEERETFREKGKSSNPTVSREGKRLYEGLPSALAITSLTSSC